MEESSKILGTIYLTELRTNLILTRILADIKLKTLTNDPAVMRVLLKIIEPDLKKYIKDHRYHWKKKIEDALKQVNAQLEEQNDNSNSSTD